MILRLLKKEVLVPIILVGLVSGCATAVQSLPSYKYCQEFHATVDRVGTEANVNVRASGCRIPQGDGGLPVPLPTP